MLGLDDGQPLIAVFRLKQSGAFITHQRYEDFAVRRKSSTTRMVAMLIYTCFDFNVPYDTVTHSLASERGSRIINP